MSVLNEKWVSKAQGDADEYCLLTVGGKWVIAFRVNGEFSTVEQEKIVGRIKDCVNACVGADANTLNAIEITGGLGEFFRNVEQISKERDQLKAQAAALGESNENWMHGFEAEKAQRNELLCALQNLHAVCVAALKGADNLTYTHFLTRTGVFVNSEPALEQAEIAIAKFKDEATHG